MLETLLHSSLKVFETNQISDLLENTSGWEYDPQYGWYKNRYEWSFTQPLMLPPSILGNLKSIEANFTGFYDIPALSIGKCNLTITLTDDSTYILGTTDAWDWEPAGQTIYRGLEGTQERVTINVINEVMRFVVPDNKKVQSITLSSAGYNENGTNYAFSVRGIKDFKLVYA